MKTGAGLSPCGRWPPTWSGPRSVHPGAAGAPLFRALVRAVPLVPGRLSAHRGAPTWGWSTRQAVAYGNGYHNGYKGKDLSGTGWGLTWDFIIVHETAHEWFGNNITTADIADMWVHESFANYSESLYTECLQVSAAGAEYVTGTRALIQNDAPVGTYGVNARGSRDMYPKGGNTHTIRHIIGDDARWTRILRGLNREFRHQIVTGRQVRSTSPPRPASC